MEKHQPNPITMKKIYFLFFAIIVFCGCHQSKKKQSAANEWMYLFDGSSLDGWRAYNGEQLPPGWTIIDSVMTFSTEMVLEQDYDYKGSKDIIYAAQEFDNFELVFEWKIPPGGNSGIFYHVVEGYAGIPVVAPEYQLIDDINYTQYHDIADYNRSIGITQNPEQLQDIQSTAADYGMHTPNAAMKNLHPAGEWNTSKIVFTPKKVEHWLNGQKVVSFTPWDDAWKAKKNNGKWNLAPDYGMFKKGFIGLQDHGSVLWFRNIRIKSL